MVVVGFGFIFVERWGYDTKAYVRLVGYVDWRSGEEQMIFSAFIHLGLSMAVNGSWEDRR